MSFAHFLPNVVKELVRHVPSLVFEVTDWSSVRRDAPLMTSRIFTKSGVSDLKDAQERRLGSFTSFKPHPEAAPFGTVGNQALGEALLRYYFAQLYCPEGLFLDLRLEHFKGSGANRHFEPNGFWYRFTDTFRAGLLDLYDGFYLSDEAKFHQGLIATRLIEEAWPKSDQERMKNLFRNHFGASLEAPMAFNLEGFQKTFLMIFEFLMEKKVILSSEFMLFGIYLVTLYMGLENLGGKYEVKRLYLEVRGELRGPLP